MIFQIDNHTETTLNELIQANELDQITINELINLKVNESYFIGICEIKKLANDVNTLNEFCENIIIYSVRKNFNKDINGYYSKGKIIIDYSFVNTNQIIKGNFKGNVNTPAESMYKSFYPNK